MIARQRVHRLIAMVGAALLMSAGLGVTPAGAADGIGNLDVAGQVAADGTLSVSATYTFIGDAPGQFVQTINTVEAGEGNAYYRFEVGNVLAAANNVGLTPVLTTDGNFVVITVDTSGIGAAPLVISYDVVGAAVSGGVASDGTAMTTVSWPVVQGLSWPVTTIDGAITVPGMIRSVDCKSGAVSGPEPCQMWGGGTYNAPNPSFQDGGLAPGGVVILTFATPSSSVAVNQVVFERWSLDRAFSIDTWPLLAALLVLIVGAALLFWLWRARGRDVTSSKEPTLVATFEPSGKGTVEFDVHEGIRPGHVGTVVDEHVDPIDITASVLDLAVRGHLCIVQLPSAGVHAPIDWTFERLESDDALRPFEVSLLDAVAPEDGQAAVVSQISGPIEHVIEHVQDQLYEEVVDRGWFLSRPNQTRHLFHLLGWVGLGVAIVALVLLVALSRFGLLGLVLVALGAGLLMIAQMMPRRTAAGVDLEHGMHALSMALQTQPTSQVPKETAYEQISKILPYAVVLGGRSRWVQALADADDDPDVPDPDDLPWYHAPDDWNIEDLPACLDAFIASLSGRLVGRD